MAYQGDAPQYQPQYQGPPLNPSAMPHQLQGYPEPGTQNFLPVPSMAAMPNIPPGLEYLTQVDQVLVHQKRYSAFQYTSQYEILNALSQLIFFAKEEREWCGPQLDVRVYDNSQRHVLHLLLPSNYCSWESEMEVYSPTTGSLIGYIVKHWEAFSISFSILNISKEMVLRVEGPGFSMSAFSDVNFEVKTCNGSQNIGCITKVHRGMLKAMFSSNDHYSVQFPIDLDAKVKALLLATALFIDYLYYDQRRRNN